MTSSAGECCRSRSSPSGWRAVTRSAADLSLDDWLLLQVTAAWTPGTLVRRFQRAIDQRADRR